MKKIIALLLLAVNMAAAQTVVTGNGVTGAQGSGNVSPSADAASDLGALSLRWRNYFLSGSIQWTNGSGTADTGISRCAALLVCIGNGTAGDFTGTVKATTYLTASGSNSIPGYGFTSFPTTGLWAATNILAFSVTGADAASINNNGFQVGSGKLIGFASNTSSTAIAADSAFTRLNPASIALGNGTAGDVSGTLTHASDVLQTANAGQWVHGQNSELLTIAAAATTDTVGNLLPANAIIEAVVVRVTTVIPTAATFTVGDATIAARFATGVAVAANTTAVGLTQVDLTGTSGPKQTAAAKVRITPSSTPGTATGVVRITVFYRSFVAPTS